MAAFAPHRRRLSSVLPNRGSRHARRDANGGAQPETVSEFDTSQRTAVAEQPSAVEGARGAPVLVTGAAGLVGAHTCRELTRRGFRVRALVRDPAKAASR